MRFLGREHGYRTTRESSFSFLGHAHFNDGFIIFFDLQYLADYFDSHNEWHKQLLAVNLVHISPPGAGMALLDGAARLLPPGGPLILYGPWRVRGEPLAPSNLAFDSALKERDKSYGLRELTAFAAEAGRRGLALAERRTMPANNLMLRFVRAD